MAAVLAACAGGSPGTDPPAQVPTILLQPDGDAWASAPTSDRLKEVSNNGFGYTGDIHLYELDVPAAGRLLISLSWNHNANFDLIVAADDRAKLRLAEGIEDATEPEYVGIDVIPGQKLFLFVAGWNGEPGTYLLETILLPPGTPLFAIEEFPDFTKPWPADAPLTFTFTSDLEPGQDLDGRIYLVHPGGVTEGTWCIDGPHLTFFPHLPEETGDERGLVPGMPHVLQFRRAARGVRAITGEYLTDLVGVGFSVGPPADYWPLAPTVTGITPAADAPYRGEAITIAFSEPLDPATASVGLVSVLPGGATVPLPFDFSLTQQWYCSGNIEVRMLVAPKGPPPAGTVTRLTLPATIRGLGGGVAFVPVTVDFPPP